MTTGLLDGVRVLDLTRLTPGAYATVLLADLGADVVKIERPGDGDYMRTLVPAAYEEVCRSKRSVTLDLKRDEGRELFLRLVAGADVVVENFRPGVVARLGVGYQALREVKPDIIFCSLSGYGQTGPYRDHSGHDLNYLGVAGALSLMGEPDGPPAHATGIAVADYNAAMFTAMSVLGALLHRATTGRGQSIDVSMTDCMASWMGRYVIEHEATPTSTRESMMRRPGYSVYRCAGGDYLTLGCIEDVFWDNLLRILPDGHPLRAYASAQRRRAEVDEVEKLLVALFAERDREEWLRVLREADVPVGPVHQFGEMTRDPQLLARGLIRHGLVGGTDQLPHVAFPVKFGDVTPREPYRAPGIGEHTADVLSTVGVDAERFAELRAAGVV